MVRRRHRSPLEIRRLAYVLILLATVVGAYSGYRDSPLGVTTSFALAVAATVVYTRATDFLMDFDLRSVRRQSTVFLVIGLLTAMLG
ncbi:MAG: hypothetical protein KC438_10190, partial [Thermomicrobiales bacterium]|nr:hypothetical protein [Thermomicrobiales bacterium]